MSNYDDDGDRCLDSEFYFYFLFSAPQIVFTLKIKEKLKKQWKDVMYSH